MRQTTRFASIVTATILAGGAATALGAASAAASPSMPVSVTVAQDAGKAAAGVTRAQAIKIAKKRVPGARVTEVERERERGHRTWQVELRKGGWEYDVYVSARTGKIVKFESDRDD